MIDVMQHIASCYSGSDEIDDDGGDDVYDIYDDDDVYDIDDDDNDENTVNNHL